MNVGVLSMNLGLEYGSGRALPCQLVIGFEDFQNDGFIYRALWYSGADEGEAGKLEQGQGIISVLFFSQVCKFHCDLLCSVILLHFSGRTLGNSKENFIYIN